MRSPVWHHPARLPADRRPVMVVEKGVRKRSAGGETNQETGGGWRNVSGNRRLVEERFRKPAAGEETTGNSSRSPEMQGNSVALTDKSARSKRRATGNGLASSGEGFLSFS